MLQYRYQELTPGQEMTKNAKEDPVKKDDHAVDALRYGMMSRPEIPKLKDMKQQARLANTLSGSVMREFEELRQGKGYKDPFGEQYGVDPGISDEGY
jgi:phage terminase large subunit